MFEGMSNPYECTVHFRIILETWYVVIDKRNYLSTGMYLSRIPGSTSWECITVEKSEFLDKIKSTKKEKRMQ